MNSSGLSLLLLIGFVGIVCIIIWIIMLITAIKKNNADKALKSFIPLGVFTIFLISVAAFNNISEKRFEDIPLVQVNEDSVTILNYGTDSMGSFSRYILAEEDENGNKVIQNTQKSQVHNNGNIFQTCDDSVLKETDRVEYQYSFNQKFGYKFTANKKGKTYIFIGEVDCACLSYFDIYEIDVGEDMKIDLINTEHIEDISDFENDIPEKYSFIAEYIDYFK